MKLLCSALVILSGWLGVCARGQAAEASRTHQGVDKRRVARPAAEPDQEQREALQSLKTRAPDAEVDFDPLLATPKWVRARTGFITGANGRGKSVSDASAARFGNDRDRAVKGFLHEHRRLFGHGAEALERAVKKRDYEHNGLRTAVWEQRVDDIPVYESVLMSQTSARGELLSISSLFVPDAEGAADRGVPNRAAKVRAPTIPVLEAIRIAVAEIGEQSTGTTPLDQPQGAELKQRFTITPLPGEATARLTWLPVDRRTLRLCWWVELNQRQRSERFRVLIDAQSGEVLVQRKLTVDVSPVSYLVFTNESPTPMSMGFPFPTNAQPPQVERSLVTLSAINTNASPLGWINDGVLETRGNNVDARVDRDGDDRADLPRAQARIETNGLRVFDFPLDLSQSPTTYSSAAAVQLFYWCNWAHDKFYELGFTEAAGNFQKDNFGRGGLGNDAIIADAQDGSGFNNANFTSAPDGEPGRIQMFIFTGPTPDRDGDLDAEVILHEYAHGLSDRLVGGGVGIFQIQTVGLSEGWSDFFAKALLSRPDDDVDGFYPMGGYASYLFSGLQQSYYFGIRRYPYTTRMDINPLTLADIDPEKSPGYPGIPRSPIINAGPGEVHRVGEVWCAMLWEARAHLIKRDGFAHGNQLIMRLVVEGMMRSPPNPTFVQARDAILQADAFFHGGTNHNELWAAFAKRGLGRSAVASDAGSTTATEAFDTPPVLSFTVSPATLPPFTGPPGGGAFAPESLTAELRNLTSSTQEWAVLNVPPWLLLSATNGTIPPRGVVTNVMILSPVAKTLVADQSAALRYTNLTVRTSEVRTVQLLLSDALRVSPKETLAIEGSVGGPFSPASAIYDLENTSKSPLQWRARTTVPWLTLPEPSGVISTQAHVQITVLVNSTAAALTNGFYTGQIIFRNETSGREITNMVTLRTGQNHLTEELAIGTFDLENLTLTFRPNGSTSFYSVCSSPAFEFPVDPSNAIPLAILDDQYLQVPLSEGKTVSIFGVSSNAIYIGANGNVTFDPKRFISGANPHFDPGLERYFNDVRAAVLYADLNPEQGGTVSWMQLSNSFVVTWQNVPEYDEISNARTNSVQLELFFNGTIRMTWLHVTISNSPPIVGLSRGNGLPVDFVKTDLSGSVPCTPKAQILIPFAVNENEVSVEGTVVLSDEASKDVVVTLSSSDTNEIVLLPSRVTIPAGQNSGTFFLSLADNDLLDGSRPVTITATFPDRPTVSATITIHDADERADLTIKVPGTADEGAGVLRDEGKVWLDRMADKPITVTLNSGNPGRVLVPPVVVIPMGERTNLFDITIVDDGLINERDASGQPVPVTIRASVANWSEAIGGIKITDNERTNLTLTLPVQVTEGQSTVINGGRVILSGVSSSPVLVTVQSDNSLVTPQPATFTIQAGQRSNSFHLVVGSNQVINAVESVRLIASAPGFISATGVVVVIDDERPVNPTNPAPANLAVNVRRTPTLSWGASSFRPTNLFFDVYLGTNADLAGVPKLGSTTNTSFKVNNLLLADTVYYWRVDARLGTNAPLPSDTWRFTTAPFSKFAVSTNPSPQFVNEPFSLSVTAQDQYGDPVTTYRGSATLTNSLPGPAGATILITELDTGSNDRLEFINVSDRPVDITGWQIIAYDWSSWPAPKLVYTIREPAVSLPGEAFEMRNISFAYARYPLYTSVTNILWNNNATNNQVAVLLRDNFGQIVDFMCAVDAVPSEIVFPMPIPLEQWSSGPIPANLDSTLSYQRVGSQDGNAASDWIIGAKSPATNNPGLTIPFLNSLSVPFTAPPLTNFVDGVWRGDVTVLEEARDLFFGVTDGLGHGGRGNSFDVIAKDDLTVSVVAPEIAFVHSPIEYLVVMSNSGPREATSVLLVDVLPPDVDFITAKAPAPPQGCTLIDGLLVCNVGNIASNSIATVRITLQPKSRGVLTNVVGVTRGEPDGYLGNNEARSLTRVSFPQVLMSDSSVAEGSTHAILSFTAALTAASTLTASVDYATSDGTATAGIDYEPVSGTLSFPPGVTNQTIDVVVYGDILNESNETFFLEFSNPVNVELTRINATGTILNDDLQPQLLVDDIVVSEGNEMRTALFTLRLSEPTGQTVTFDYATTNGTAIAGFDYIETYGMASFPPGQTSVVVAVTLVNDTISEPSKDFFLMLTGIRAATWFRNRIQCTLQDDDVQLHHFAVEPQAVSQYAGVGFPVTVTAKDADDRLFPGFNGTVTLSAEQNVAIGANQIPWAFPLGASFHDSRLQVIYLTNELGSAGTLSSLSLNVATVPGQVLSNWTIRLRHTTLDHYQLGAARTALWDTNNNWTVVYQQDAAIVAPGWMTFNFNPTNKFQYNGTNHLLVDFSFDNSSFSMDGLCFASDTTAARSIYLRSDSAYGPPTGWRGTTPTNFITSPSRIPNVRFTKERVTSVLPATLSGFAGGVWQGQVSVNAPSTNTVLRVLDDEGHSGISSPIALFAVEITTIDLVGSNQVRIVFPTIAGKSYLLEARASLPDRPPAVWLPIQGPILGDGSPAVFTSEARQSSQFFRVRLLP